MQSSYLIKQTKLQQDSGPPLSLVEKHAVFPGNEGSSLEKHVLQINMKPT